MKRVAMSVFDTAAASFGQPFFVPAVAAGVRAVADEVNRAAADNQLFQHPEDHVVYVLGHFDDVSGELTNVYDSSDEKLEKLPRVVARCKDLVRSKQ